MSDTTLKDAGGIFKYGGGVLKVSECDDAGGTVSADYTDLGYIEVTEFIDEVSEEVIKDETGSQVKKVYGDRTVQLNATLMQTNVEVLDFIIGSKAKYFQLYYKSSKTGDSNGKTQELFGGIVQITPAIRVRSGERKLPISITFLNNEAAITIATPNTTYGSIRSTTVTIPANEFYDIVETA